MSSLRILQIVPSISLVYGGPSQMVLGLSKALVAKGVEVTILTTNSNGDTGQAPLDVPLDRPVSQDGYQIRYFRCAPFRRYKFSIRLLRWLTRHAHEFDLAHIHALFSPISTAAAAIARQQQLPYILRPLGTLDPVDVRKKRALKQIYAALWERANLAGATAVHFTSDQEAKVSERFGVVTRDLVIPLGVNLPASTTPRTLICESVTPLILFMSRIDRKKGLDLLIPALERLSAEGRSFRFVLAGSNPQDSDYERSIRHRIQNSPLGQQTTITGFVSGDAKLRLLRSADLFVLPSYYENFGIAVAEAMAAGVPVVISDQVHIWQDIAQSQSGWVCSCQIEDLTQKLRIALQDNEARQQRGTNAQTYAQTHYNWDSIAQQMIQAYEQIKNKA
ncbi:MAG TPA: hormogonium polysaccharide biosynthesis glycosyltransferase HpsP [Trichocoleus sp.]|jgi:glycosyltransferase involved in cell wall biosynthesis